MNDRHYGPDGDPIDDDWDEETIADPTAAERARDASAWAIIIVGLGLSLAWLLSQISEAK